MAEIKIALKTTEFVQKGGPYDYGSRAEERTAISEIGVTIEADENGVAALTADDCRMVARLLSAMAGTPPKGLVG